MPDTDQNQNQAQDEQYQVTGDDLAELHGLASQMDSAGDPRAGKLWDFIDSQSGGDATKTMEYRFDPSQAPTTSWLDDLEKDLSANNAKTGSDQSSQSSKDANGDTDGSDDATDNADEEDGEPADTSGDNDGTDGEMGPGDGWGIEQGRFTPASAEDIANGNYIKIGFRHLIGNPKFPYHSYIHIPVIGQDGKPEKNTEGKDKGKDKVEKWGVLGEKNSSENQQVRDDPRNDQQNGQHGKEVYVKVTPEQREALRERMKYFKEQDEDGKFIHPCPVCGPNYHLLKQNSNSFVYNMLFWNPAGMIWAPKPPKWTVKYGENMGDNGWYK